MENLNETKYKRAKERVKKIRGFYVHLAIFVVINSFLLLNTQIMAAFGESSVNIHVSWWGIGFWALGLFIHGIKAFDKIPFLGKEWEERKIKEFMKEEEGAFKNNNWE